MGAAFVAVILMSLLVESCRQHHDRVAADDTHYAQVDSMLSAIEDVDTLAAMVKKYHDSGDVKGEVLALRNYGRRLRKLSRYDESIQVQEKGFELAMGIEDTIEMVSILNNMATAKRHLGDLSEAHGLYLQALRLSDLYSDQDSPTAIKQRVVALNGIGNIEIELRDYDDADSIFHMALAGETKLGSYTGMAINYANLGAAKQGMNDIDSAWYYYRKSLEYYQLCKNPNGVAITHKNFGKLYESSRNFSHAKNEYKLAYDQLKEQGDVYEWLESCLALAGVSMLLGEVDDAHAYQQEAEAEARRINSKDHLAEAYRLHYDLSLLRGNPQEALDYYIKSDELLDSIYGLEKNEAIRHQRIEYDMNAKHGEVTSLTSDIERLKRMRNWMALFSVLLLIMAGGIIATLIYALKVRTRTQRMLRQVETTRSLFFTNVVHQLRTPLTAIMGATDDLVESSTRDGGLDGARLKSVELIERQGKNLLVLVDRILEVGGVRSAIREPEWRTGDAVAFVHMIVESYRERCVERHIELNYTPREACVSIDTVPRYLNTILGSMLDNAINYSKDFSKITVSTMVEKGNFVIKVTDNGMGITRADLSHVFEPFYRGAMAERLMEGVGIGLTVARDMTMAMGGTVSAQSENGLGSEFTVSLPLKHGNSLKQRFDYIVEPVAALARRRERVDEDQAADDTLPLVLVVEDHTDVALLVGKVLKGRCNVQYATDGEQALAKMQQQLPDLLITDVKMPKMDGHELCRRVRASVKLRGIPVIMLSARSSEKERVLGVKAGADVYLVKPFLPDELRVWADHLLKRHQNVYADVGFEKQNSLQSTAMQKPACAEACVDDETVQAEFLEKFRQELDKQMSTCVKLDLDKIALSFKMGETQLKQKVQHMTGKTFAAYVTQLRMEKAMNLLKTCPDLRIGDVAELCGFVDVAYFSRVFRQHFGMTPTQARTSGA